MTVQTFTVSGMTCGHCVSSVREEVGEVPGVTAVEVELTTGLLTVTGEADPGSVVTAVKEAGYSVVSP
ncbi:heavy-metal-associated domain-containing protein [Acrocarpospora catenulata]|uniref:heavy-metal-associated domain-containing protein n=1 Tax=Acrocarpospora catenulata TaxID=2836182 RepID=UPI001BDB24A8|nr:heavy-metal-associated domain-containing protein [Acrocarpospora catenulata]